MTAAEYVTEISVPSFGDGGIQRLSSHMREPEPLPESEAGTITPAEAIKAAELIEAETRYRNQVGREMYEAGRRDTEAEMAARWDEIARAAVRGPSHAELEERRWGPGGREHFADARPGDFPGLDRQPEPEREMEIS